MQTNALPHYDDSDNTTGCCPRFNPEGWDGQDLHFRDEAFVRATTKSAMHVPLNMGNVFVRVHRHLQDAGADDPDDFVVLSRDLSPWQSEHLFAVSRPVPQEETTRLTGDYVTRVFEGPYRDARHWHAEMATLARDRGATADEVDFFYTTCPRCAKADGRNYVVGVARTA
ncbi:hydrolase [Albidovulum sp.]|uniref:hydrolase n=1 Tax=Albidovulum sp. TaxID=1872424 RepID=UPI0039B96D73